MPAWTGLQTWSAGAVLTAALLTNKVNANLEYLLTPNKQFVFETTGTYSASVTSYANIGSSLAVNLTTYGGHVLMYFHAYVALTGAGAYTADIALNLDGAQTKIHTTDSQQPLVGIPYLWTPAAGAHTIAVQWKVSNVAGTASIAKDKYPLVFMAIEL